MEEKEHSQDWLCPLLFLFGEGEPGDSSLILGMMNELGKTVEFGFFPFGGGDPISAYPLVPRGLGKEKFPGELVGTELLFLVASEACAFALFVGVDAGFLFVARGESFEAGRMHEAVSCELSDEVNVDGAPGAGGFARSEADGVAGFVEALTNAVDPAEAKGDFYRFGPGDTGFS